MAKISENLQIIKNSIIAIKQAIINRGGSIDGDITTWADSINNIDKTDSDSSKNPHTGHADVEGLRAIGWTDEDIAYYQENGVNWNEEDDEYHKVTDDNKELYGVLTTSNISEYTDRIIYLPKINTSDVTDMSSMFMHCRSLISIPQLDTSNVTNMSAMFADCLSLISIPQLDTSNVTSMTSMFLGCPSLISIPQLDTSNVTNMTSMFMLCYSLISIPQLDTSKVTDMNRMFAECHSLISIPQLDTSNVTNMDSMFSDCYSLISIPQLDTINVTNMTSMFSDCYSLISIPQLDTINVTNMTTMLSNCYSLIIPQIKNIKISCSFDYSTNLSKDSLLYIINNEATESPITIILNEYTYNKWATNADIVSALTNHPNISLF